MKAKTITKPRGTDIDIYVVSPPKFRMEVTASNYKEAKALMKQASETVIQSIEKDGGEGFFESD